MLCSALSILCIKLEAESVSFTGYSANQFKQFNDFNPLLSFLCYSIFFFLFFLVLVLIGSDFLFVSMITSCNYIIRSWFDEPFFLSFFFVSLYLKRKTNGWNMLVFLVLLEYVMLFIKKKKKKKKEYAIARMIPPPFPKYP